MLDSAVLSDSLDADATLGDLTREEALRWDVLPLGAQNLGALGGEHVRTEHVEL